MRRSWDYDTGEAEKGSWAGGLGRGRGWAKDTPKRLGKKVFRRNCLFCCKRAEDLHALRHKASADFRKYIVKKGST